VIVEAVGLAKSWAGTSGLSPVDFVVEPGTVTCVKGRSGTGKSTLLALLTGFIDGDRGLLRWAPGFAPVVDAPWSAIAFVPQTLLLLTELSVVENVSIGASTDVDVDDLLVRLGLEGLGRRTVDALSNGQRQRVALARAILRDAPILLLDEATSALDSESEILVQEALWHLMRDRTALVVAHRLSTVVRMDRLIVLDQGRIVEQGTHSQLLAAEGPYARLWNHQSGGFLSEEDTREAVQR